MMHRNCLNHGLGGFRDYTDFCLEHGLGGLKDFTEIGHRIISVSSITNDATVFALKKSVPSVNPGKSVMQTLKELI